MRVSVRLFSILRECLPPGSVRNLAEIDLPDGTHLQDLIVQFGIDRYLNCRADELISRAGWEILINGKSEGNMTRLLQEADEVQIFPPVSGGSAEVA